MSIKIGIIDSGVRLEHPLFKNKKIYGYSLFCDEDGRVYKKDDFFDEVGHGTAIYYIISNCVENAKIINIKIYNENNHIGSYQFEKILEYLYENEELHYLNISMGIVNYGSIDNLSKICQKFVNRGTHIISAFDNDGAVSFPAALANVIGVDTTDNIQLNRGEYICIENNMVNILTKKNNIRVAWSNPDYILVKGNSFSCAEVTAKLAKIAASDVKEICNKTIYFDKIKENINICKIKKAVVFPFNKEVHSIARFYELLDFEIVDFYSARITGQVNKKICEIVENSKFEKEIKNIDNLDWNSFDTIILGHLDELSKITKINLSELLVKEAIKNKKNIYTFDNLYHITNNYPKYYAPVIENYCINKRYGKLYKTDRPVLGIIGTNSKQGKFTLQLNLRKKFIDSGYKVGQLGTEPSALLFGIDEVFHSGYGAHIDLRPYEIYSIVNQMIWNIAQKNVDIIITGCQSGLIAYNDYNISMLPFEHQILFEATQPDAIILCINNYDSINFVERTIKFAEGISGGKVIALVCYPLDYTNNWKSAFGAKTRISSIAEEKIKKEYLEKLNKHVYLLDNNNDIDCLFDACINYFQG